MSDRTFEDRPAVREATPLLAGLIGPSSSGKTFSALRLATGIQRVSGGDIFVIDTESRRSLHYAEKFKFRHLPFAAPFGPLDYLAAIEHCVHKGAGVIVVDSMSHEHEGPGGVLEQHEAELDRLAGQDYGKRNRMTMLAWAKPKAARRRLINSLMQINANFIFCFRAKPKMQMVKGQDPVPLGFMPIAGEEFVYELTVKCLLLPGANGVPTWNPEHVGERAMVKLPEQFRGVFAESRQLDETIGEQLATWAKGGSVATPPINLAPATAAELIEAYELCQDAKTFAQLETERASIWKGLGKDHQSALKSASEAAKGRVAA